jgi:hypothetical protein
MAGCQQRVGSLLSAKFAYRQSWALLKILSNFADNWLSAKLGSIFLFSFFCFLAFKPQFIAYIP